MTTYFVVLRNGYKMVQVTIPYMWLEKYLLQHFKHQFHHRLRPLIQMAEMEGTTTGISIFTTADNGTGLTGKIYVFTPAGSSTKLTLLLILAIVGIVAFIGNTLMLCFLKTKKKANNFLKMCCFEKNFNFYIQSLAISDVLSAAISLPAVCINISFDLFQQGWGCRIVRYLNMVFPTITMDSLLLISIERYCSTRQVPRTFQNSTVRKTVFTAWFVGFFFALIPAATFKGIRYDLNDTHYTVVCKYDNQYLSFRIMFLSYTILQYILPSILIIRISVSLFITVWKRTRGAVDVQQDNVFTLARKAARIHSMCIIITLMFAFVIPYILYVTYVIYNMVTKPRINFQTDYIIRYTSALIALSNSAVNVIIYMVQMKDFRSFLKKQFITRVFGENVNPVGVRPVE